MVVCNPRSGAAAFALFSFLPTGLPAQGSWSQTPTSGSPPQLGAHAAAYDLANQRTLVFGGFDQTFATVATTWRFDGVSWTQSSSPLSPPARAGHAMAYDSMRGRVVMFGGVPTIVPTSSMNDTWEFDGYVWTQRLAVNMPAARSDHAMCYDMVRNRVVLYGGRLSNHAAVGDTWEWDGNGWINTTAVGPTPRYQHAMCFDLTHMCTVLFGGQGNVTFGDTWHWDGVSWQQLQPALSPSSRSGHAMAYDMSRSVSVLHGGAPDGAETWEWDGAVWTQHASTVYPKNNHVLVYDARLQRSTLIGGMVTASPVHFPSEVETYGHPIAGSFQAFGASCPGTTSTPHLSSPTSLQTGPMIGQTSILQVTPTWVHTFFVFGWSDTFDGQTPLPHDLSLYGMPGCSLQVSRDAITSAIPSNGTATLQMPIANDPFLVGVRFYAQGFSLDIGANAGGFTTTNRLEGVVGRS